MADLILGQPSNLTTVSAGTGGNIRVTYEPWELDWEWFDTIAIGNWLANTTTAVSVAITAKGGAEHLGYWFEINLAFPSANWNTGDRITPQRQAAINQFATFAAAIAAMAFNDVFLIWYQSLANLRCWSESQQFANIAGSEWGMLSRRQIYINGAGTTSISFTGNLLGQNQQSVIRNLGISAQANVGCITYSPIAGQAGAGLRLSRCAIKGSASTGVSFGTNANNNTCQMDNCAYMGGIRGVVMPANKGVIYDSVCYNTGNTGFEMGSSASRNCVAFEVATSCYTGALNCLNCADTDGTLPVNPTNLRNQDVRTQFRFFWDTASPGDLRRPEDVRIHLDSVLAGVGVAVPAVVTDADGQLRPDPPSIGAYEPYPVAYAPGAEIIRCPEKRGVGA